MSDPETEKSSNLSFRIEKLLSVGLLAVPCAAILSASFYFLLLSSAVQVIPLSFFNLQDHFDKAVDLLIPVFLAVAVMNFSGAFFAGVFDGASKRREEKKESPAIAFFKDWFPPVVFTGLGTFGWLTHPDEDRWQYILFVLFGVLMFGLRLLPRTFGRLLSTTKMSWVALWGTLLSLAGLTAYIINNVDSAIYSAKKSSFADEKPTLVDNFSFGHLLIEDGKFKVKTTDGALLAEGPPLSRESKSMACEWGWSWACQFTKTYGAQQAANKAP